MDFYVCQLTAFFEPQRDRTDSVEGTGVQPAAVPSVTTVCYLVVVAGRPLFVEPKLKGRFHKWNSNHGLVYPSRLHASSGAERAESEPDAQCTECTVDDVPQCFSHWSYEASRSTRMVCDLQGFYTGGRFVLVDPVRVMTRK